MAEIILVGAIVFVAAIFAVYCLQISWQVCGTVEGDPFRVPCQSSVIDVDLASGRMMG